MISTKSVQKAYEALFSGGVYVSLHTADPQAAGHNEVRGGDYKRQGRNISAPNSSGEMALVGQVAFTGMPAAMITHYGLGAAASLGNFLWGFEADEPKATNKGDVFQLDGGWLVAKLG